MFYEKKWMVAHGEQRSMLPASLSAKLAISMEIGGAGFIEWIWNTNPFMKSDNEAAIGPFPRRRHIQA